MGGDAEREAGGADRLEVSIGQIFLAEMQVLRAGLDRRAPVIVDDEARARALDGGERLLDDRKRLGIVEVFRTQLNGADAEFCEARDPGDAVDDRIKTIRIRHARTESR